MINRLTWTIGKARLGDLVEYEQNPTQLTEKAAQGLAKLLREYGRVYPYLAAAPKNGKKIPMLDGHSRKRVEMELLGRTADTLVEVNFPSRKLTEKEKRNWIIAHRRYLGQFDNDSLLNWYEPGELMEFGGFGKDELKDIGFQDFIHFEPVSADEQGRLDQKSPVVCPNCKHEFIPK